MRPAEWVFAHLHFLTSQQRSEHELGYVFGQRSNCCEDQRGRSTQEHSYRQRLIGSLRFLVMEAAALLNLPMQSRRPFVIDLHTVNTKIVLFGGRIFGVNKRKGDKRPAILLPCS